MHALPSLHAYLYIALLYCFLMTIAKYCAQPIKDPRQQKQPQLIATTQKHSRQRATIPGIAQFVAKCQCHT